MSDDPSPELFAIVPIPPPGTYRDTLQRDAIVTGSLDEVMEYIPQSLSRLEVEELRASIPPILEQLKLFERQKSELKDITNGV